MDSDSSLPSKLEISKLRCILDSLEDEIKLSYTQTRPKFNDEVEAQLRHALSEVSHREKDLIAIVGISKHLIQSYQDLEEKFLKLQEKSETLSQNLESLNSENFKLKEENQLMEDKYLETVDDKNKLDEEVHRLESRLQVMKREMSKKSVKLSLDISNYMSASDEIFDLSSHYKEELEAGRSKK
jgi:chromosome segregation ATPase